MGLIGSFMLIDRDPHQGPSAKARILRAAMLLFAQRPFSETSLRDIATAAQVDVAYVHRAFGSKAEIFRQALHSRHVIVPEHDDLAQTVSGEAFIERICDLALSRNPECVADVEALHLVMQSCACSDAREIVADFIEQSYAKPLAEGFGQQGIGRAMFAISLVSGFTLMRCVVNHPALQTIPKAELRAMLKKALQGAMAGECPSQ